MFVYLGKRVYKQRAQIIGTKTMQEHRKTVGVSLKGTAANQPVGTHALHAVRHREDIYNSMAAVLIGMKLQQPAARRPNPSLHFLNEPDSRAKFMCWPPLIQHHVRCMQRAHTLLAFLRNLL